MTKKKVYILYKVKRNEDGFIQDLDYQAELENYEQVIDWLHIARRTISKITNNNATNWEQLKTYNNYCIIKE